MTESEKKNIFVHCTELEQYPYPQSCPFKTCRAGQVRKMLDSMGLLTGPNKSVAAPQKATFEELSRFHTKEYLQAIQRADKGDYDYEMLYMNLGTGDCPVFAGMYDYAAWAAGATLTAARAIIAGTAAVAFNPSGGYHHAFDDHAGGFCYLNDVVLGCMELAGAGKKVVFLDIDVHHCDGVQAAFYDRCDVMTISLHQDGRTLFPGTGFTDEIGAGEGRGYAVNLPMPPGTYDELYLKAFHQVVVPLISARQPDVLVLEAGADTLQGDPLAGLCLTNNVFVDIINSLLAFGKPILAVGGGGYNVQNTVRAWALIWTALCGEQLAQDMTAGMGGVMLENMDWAGGAGLRDRVLIPSAWQRQNLEPAVNQIIEQVKQTVFPIHKL
ncbi:MAG TPA: acetoin utilization protein AcuC [Anaerohalosphaeraceae bacterium]|nr:acetoin utilization protein AcuC [Anaerohalosphaeraceae bacterium]HOL31414.1 acetoin utilization protein AcuC [Anaerohalosphaeraceae bacterium]HOM74978.1 acetoin utilization protein AcuC [Anaerohalosphaeraceae bacterium]HPC63230.1 acetoin utilization protein AcuC [Anaerohalosphaeraceae bacterium]HPO69283.1 acetoin utilization protein AcuC [Anaerohalosphaeraceae bacterium]